MPAYRPEKGAPLFQPGESQAVALTPWCHPEGWLQQHEPQPLRYRKPVWTSGACDIFARLATAPPSSSRRTVYHALKHSTRCWRHLWAEANLCDVPAGSSSGLWYLASCDRTAACLRTGLAALAKRASAGCERQRERIDAGSTNLPASLLTKGLPPAKRVVIWLLAPADPVQRNEPSADIETDTAGSTKHGRLQKPTTRPCRWIGHRSDPPGRPGGPERPGIDGACHRGSTPSHAVRSENRGAGFATQASLVGRPLVPRSRPCALLPCVV